MNDHLIATAQIWLSALFLTGYFIVIILFMLGYANIPTDYKEAFSGLLSLMTGGGLTVLYFWFQRSRGAGIPDPVTTTIRTETSPPPAPQTTIVTTTPTGATDENPPTIHPAIPTDAPERLPDAGN